MGRRARAAELTPGQAVTEFCETYLIVPEGAHVGRKVVLRPWQREIVLGIYDRPTRQAIVSLARKNGKTSLIAMLVLAHLVGPEARRNAQIYSAAQSREQAGIVFSLAAKMVRMSAELNELVTVRDTAKELYCSMTGVRYKALSADATTAYGLSPVLVIHDELGQVRGPRSELYDALESAMGAQAAPLSVVISTQAPTDADLLSMLIDDAEAGHDPTTRLFMYSTDVDDDDPWSEETWRKANPALGDFRSLEEMRREAEKAKRLPSFESSFRNLLLNQRVAAQDHFLTPEVWKLNGGEPDPAVLQDYEVFGGLDLSGTTDMTALVLVAKDGDGTVHVFPHFWVPETGLRERALRDRAPYDVWLEQGLLNVTPGRTVNYGFVARKIGELATFCDLQVIGFDRWRIEDLRREFDEIGLYVALEPIGQGFKDMAPAVEKVAGVALNGEMRHGMHPVLSWNAANAITRADEAGNLKFDKKRATGRIDGIVALAMGIEVMSRTGDLEHFITDELISI